MFWKVAGGIVAFFAAVVLGALLMAAAGVATVGAVVGSAIENMDFETVQVTDTDGHTETINLDELDFENGRLEVVSRNGDHVMIDLDLPRIEVQEGGRDGDRVIIDGQSIVAEEANGSTVRFNGRTIEEIRFDGVEMNERNFDAGHVFRPVARFFSGLVSLLAVGMIVLGVWLVGRNHNQPGKGAPVAADGDLPKEKGPESVG